ncbi:MAG: shikimate kinase [Alphaproteobacteria bacterium]|nr:shikimate kinase [Alphaproteobacteria bacterium]
MTLTITKPVVLIGMMGAGKSYMGAKLAAALGVPFHDSDALVEERAGHSVGEVFEVFGEEKFRESEARVIQNLLEQGPSVISTGGGAVTNPQTLAAIKDKALSVWLNPDLDILVKRVKSGDKRPLLAGQDPAEKLSALLDERRHLYRQADITLDIHNDNKRETLERLIKALSETANSARF